MEENNYYLQNVYHRYIDLPFELEKPKWENIKQTFSREQKAGSKYYDIKDKGDTDVYVCNTPENDKKVTEFLDKFNLFYDSKLLFNTKSNDSIKVHIDNNKEEDYSDDPKSFIDNHAKLNITWEVPGGGLRWWELKNEDNLIIDTHTQKNGKKWHVIWSKEEDCNMVYERTINKPSIVNTGMPHSTHNPSNVDRFTLSYNLVRKTDLKLVTFFEALWLFDGLLEA